MMIEGSFPFEFSVLIPVAKEYSGIVQDSQGMGVAGGRGIKAQSKKKRGHEV